MPQPDGGADARVAPSGRAHPALALALLFAVVMAAAVGLPMTTATSVGWAALFLLAAAGLLRHRRLDLGDLVLVTALAAVASLSSPTLGLWTLAGGLATASVLHARGLRMPWFGWQREGRWTGLGVAVGAGLALGAVNVALGMIHGAPTGDLDRLDPRLVEAARAGIHEELGLRAPLMALCLWLAPRWPRRRLQVVLLLAVMVLPHAAMHLQGRAAAAGHRHRRAGAVVRVATRLDDAAPRHHGRGADPRPGGRDPADRLRQLTALR